VLAGAQVAILGLSQIALAPAGFWLSVASIQAYALWLAYGLIKPNKRLFFNGKRLLVCDLTGHKLVRIEHPRGFCSPFFIGLRLSPWRSIGLTALQMEAPAFGELLRWMRQNSSSHLQKNRNKDHQSVQKR